MNNIINFENVVLKLKEELEEKEYYKNCDEILENMNLEENQKVIENAIRDDNCFVDLFYIKKRIQYEIMIIKDHKKNNFGKGFCFALNEFENSPIIKNYIGKRLLEDIYLHVDLENDLHEKFKNKDELLKIGIKDYIINLTHSYDECLSIYLGDNKELLCNIEERFNKIIDNWEKYENIPFEEFMDITDEFVKYNPNCDFTAIDLSYYLKYSLGIDWSEEYTELMKDNSNISMSDEEFFKETFKNISLKDKNVLAEYDAYIKYYRTRRSLPIGYAIQKIR